MMIPLIYDFWGVVTLNPNFFAKMANSKILFCRSIVLQVGKPAASTLNGVENLSGSFSLLFVPVDF